MRIGIIAEGVSDLAVIRNILKAVFDIDRSDIQHIRPEDSYDETDLAQKSPPQMSQKEFGSWTLVKKECESATEINNFFEIIADSRYLVIHLDADTRQDFGVFEPDNLSDKKDMSMLRQNIIAAVKSWLPSPDNPNIIYAIAIQAIESWVLTLFLDDKETGLLLNPKKRLEYQIKTKYSDKELLKINSLSAYDRFLAISKDFAKKKKVTLCLERNQSLKDFFMDLEAAKNTDL
jgi:hypothetical protein